MRLTDIPDTILNRVTVPNNVRPCLGTISNFQNQIIDYVSKTCEASMSYKRNIINVMNSVTFYVLTGDYIDADLSKDSGVKSIVPVNDNILRKSLNHLYIDINDVEWDIDPVSSIVHQSGFSSSNINNDLDSDNLDVNNKPLGFRQLFPDNSENQNYTEYDVVDTASSGNRESKDKDISFAFKKVPKLDPDKVWAVGHDVYGRQVPIYVTLPEIPRVQNDITVTTDINKMSKQDLLNLFPTKRLRPRHEELYEKVPGFDWDPILGYIPRILDFTKDQIIENLIKYPKFSLLFRTVGEQRVSFTNFIELDEGNIVPWNVAAEISPDMVALPKSKIFYRDYIVRRYLLERDILHMEHKYPMFGTFDPFMTLFTTMDEYAKLGYDDFESMARQCVVGRVKFFQTRNPLVRGLLDESGNS